MTSVHTLYNAQNTVLFSSLSEQRQRDALLRLHTRADDELKANFGSAAAPAIFRECFISGTTAHIPFSGISSVNITRASRALCDCFGPGTDVTLRSGDGSGVLSVPVDYLFATSQQQQSPQQGFHWMRFFVLCVYMALAALGLRYLSRF
jgi:hypothetical protein